MKSQPILQPITRYYRQGQHPMPASTEDWIERLPMCQKLALAAALLNQCDRIFQNAPKLSVMRPNLLGDDAS